MFGVIARLGAISAVLAAALIVAACGGDSGDETAADSAAARELTEVKFAYFPFPDFAALKIGMDRGTFEKHGIKLTFAKPAATPAAQIAQLLNGQIQAGGGGVTGVITAVAQNVPVRAVSTYTRNYAKDGRTQDSMIVPADSDIRSFGDLEGKTVGVNSLKGTWEVGVKEAIAKDGGDPSTVKIVAIPFNAHPAALEKGTVDAAGTIQPFSSQLIEQGYRSLGSTSAAALGNATGSDGAVFMSDRFIDEHPGVVKGWNAALAEASAYANSHPEETREVISAETGQPIAALKKLPLPSFSAQLDPSVVQTWADLLVKYGILDAAPAVEDVVADEAVAGAPPSE